VKRLTENFKINKEELDHIREFLSGDQTVVVMPAYVARGLVEKIDELEVEKRQRLKLVETKRIGISSIVVLRRTKVGET